MMKSELVISKVLCYDRFTCGICIESLPFNKKFKSNQNKTKQNKTRRFQCLNHPFCCDCISKYIQAKVEHNNMAEIKCPDTKCDMILDPVSCRPILPKVTFERWCGFLCESLVRSSALGKSAYCPHQRCSELILNECGWSSRVTMTTCPKCKNLFCFRCQIPWQGNHACSTKVKERGDKEFLELVKRNNWRHCPTCSRCIERTEGCTLIMCRCNTRFCYFCGSKVTKSVPCDCERSRWDMYHGNIH